MKIGGPFYDSSRSDQPKKWYLSYFIPKKHPDGTIVLREGKPVLIRKRPYYDSKDDAQADKPAILAKYASAGTTVAGGVLTRDQVAEYEQAKVLVPEASLSDLARFWRTHHPLTVVKRVRELAPIYLADLMARLGKTAHYEDLKSRVGNLLVSRFGDRIPETITRQEAMAWLKEQPGMGRTILNLKQSACAFFNWLRGEAHVTHNPFEGIKRRQLPKKISANEIRFLSLDYVEGYLRALERYDPELIAHEIIQLLAGVRADDEMANFNGDWVLAETREIKIPAGIAKTGAREVINEIEPIFWKWWKIYGRGGLLRPANYFNRWRRVRILTAITLERSRAAADALAGESAFKLQAQPQFKPMLQTWPWNARRRTFVTYHVAKHQSADKTALIIRHRGDTYTLHQSYRGLGVTQLQGEAYFKTTPRPVKTPLLPAAASRAPRGIVRFRLEQAQAARMLEAPTEKRAAALD
jgi:hypothetical protein